MQKKKLWQRTLLTVFVILLYRLCFLIPTPGVDHTFFRVFLQENAALGFLDSLSGNGLGNLSVMALGITPYINATIILQLLGAFFQPIQLLQQGAGRERSHYHILTLCLSWSMALLESFSLSIIFGQRSMLNDYTWYWVLLVSIIWSLTSLGISAFGMFMGERKDLFIGNGISLFIGANILSSYPGSASALYQRFFLDRGKDTQALRGVILIFLCACLFSAIFYFQETQKEIPVFYAGKISGSHQHVLPVRLAPGGIMPVIFASTVITVPVAVASLIGKEYWWTRYLDTSQWFLVEKPEYTLGLLVYMTLLFFFSCFYMDISFNSNEVVNNLRKKGGMIAHAGSGDYAVQYLSHELRKTNVIGSFFMGAIVIFPFIISGLFDIRNLSFLGTSALISISVFYELWKDFSSSWKGESYWKGGIL